jgi:hypothetical protein
VARLKQPQKLLKAVTQGKRLVNHGMFSKWFSFDNFSQTLKTLQNDLFDQVSSFFPGSWLMV